MSDEQIKDMLTRYVCAEMELLPAMDEIPEHPPYSKRFNRKMKHIMRAGDWFGNWRVYSVLYKAASGKCSGVRLQSLEGCDGNV